MRIAMLALGLVMLTVAGCGGIKTTQQVAQPENQTLMAGIGDTILEVEKRESMPNVTGNADIFGRTRPTGRVIVTYLGVEQGRAAFQRQNISIQSNATTMNSTPLVVPQNSTTNFSATGGGAYVTGTATTSRPPVVLPPSGSATQVVGNNRIVYYLDLSETSELLVEGRRILIEGAEPHAIRYRITSVR